MLTQVRTVSDSTEAKETIAQLTREGFVKDSIFVLTHNKKRTNALAEQTGTQTVGIEDEGFLNAAANLFRSTGDELRSKLKSLGVTEHNAKLLEKEMDNGKIVIIGWGGNLHFNQTHGDPDIVYSPAFTHTNK